MTTSSAPEGQQWMLRTFPTRHGQSVQSVWKALKALAASDARNLGQVNLLKPGSHPFDIGGVSTKHPATLPEAWTGFDACISRVSQHLENLA